MNDTTIPSGRAGGRKPGAEPARLGRGRLTARRFLRNRLAVAGAIGILLLVVVAVGGPYFLPWHFDDIDTSAFLKPPSAEHVFGTTQAGRDVLALVVRGMSRSLIIGFVVAVAWTLLASVMGSVAAYFGGWVERIILWVIDLLLIVPSFLIVATATRGAPQGDMAWVALVIAMAALGWMLTARVVRSMTMSLKQREYVLAARFMGLGSFRIIARHILPNISSYLIIDITLGVGSAILGETGYSFLGFGVQAPDTSLGTLMAEGASLATSFPWIFLLPACVLIFLVMCVNAVGDGLRDALDPSSASGGQA